MLSGKDLVKALLISLWFMFLSFPMLALKVDPIQQTVIWRWNNVLYMGAASFVLYLAGRSYLKIRQQRQNKAGHDRALRAIEAMLKKPAIYLSLLAGTALFALAFPLVFSAYQTNIMITALMYVVLGLGLNIVVGMAGLLDLGFVAFYAVGAYTYALLNLHFGIGFWTALPIGALTAAVFGIMLGFPVLRLRGDYLAIVTLGFGEIIRLVLENWNDFSHGPSGIANIPRPGFFGLDLTLKQDIIYLYYLMIGMVLFTIFIVNRLKHSRMGRAWFALREDEIACQAMGIDKTRTKLAAFSLGATWAGMAGVIFAAKTTFVNPASFTFLESAIILCIVVLGGMGSIIGVIFGAFILILLPEHLRALADFRMLAFGAILVLMMIFRPQGLISNMRRTYTLQQPEKGQ
jgi:branched-chain amino acid transport system permease protein